MILQEGRQRREGPRATAAAVLNAGALNSGHAATEGKAVGPVDPVDLVLFSKGILNLLERLVGRRRNRRNVSRTWRAKTPVQVQPIEGEAGAREHSPFKLTSCSWLVRTNAKVATLIRFAEAT